MSNDQQTPATETTTPVVKTYEQEAAESRVRLEAAYGADNVWDTDQLRDHFEVLWFSHSVCGVRRKSDGVKGSLAFDHHPRFYYSFSADSK